MKKAKKVRKQSKRSPSKTVQASKKGIAPLGDRVLVKPMSDEEISGKKNSFGIIIPDTVSKEKSAQGRVIAVGPGRYDDGELVPMQVKVGDLVIFSKYSYDEVERDGAELYLIKEENILAVIK